MEESLQNLIGKVDRIQLILPDRTPKCWSEIHSVNQRQYVYAGELLNFALTLDFGEENGDSASATHGVWRSLRYSPNAGYSVPDRSPGGDGNNLPSCDEDAEQQLELEQPGSEAATSDRVDIHSGKCIPFATMTVTDADVSAKTVLRDVEPILAAHEEGLVLPMSVTLGDLPECDEGEAPQVATISVDITKPRGNPHKTERDRVEMLLKCPIDEVLQSEEKLYVIHNVSTNFPVLPPPDVSCQHYSIAGKHYIVTKVCNKYPEELLIQNLQVFVNKNSNLESPGSATVLSSDVGDWSSFLSIELLPSQRDQLFTTLQPKEEHTFVFQITWDCSLPSNRPDEPVQFPLFLVIEWCTPSMAMEQTIQSHYHLPTVTMDFPSFIMLAHCQSPVSVGQSFTVTYTLLNNLQDFLGITLIWMPGRAGPSSSDDMSQVLVDSVGDRIVCQEPYKHLGVCKKGATLKVPVRFQALKTGVQEIGRYIKLKLQYSSRPTSSKHNSATSQLTPPCPSPSTSRSTPDRRLPLTKSVSQGQMINEGKKGYLSRQMSLATTTSHPIRKFLAGIRSHSFSGESGDEERRGGSQRDFTDDERLRNPAENGHSTPPRSQSCEEERLSVDSASLSVDRIAKHKCQVYIVA